MTAQFRETWFEVQVRVVDCREAVHVDVLPATRANSDSAWERESYTLEVEEDKLYDNILQLEIEGLQGDQMRRCQFYITNDEAPFVIDNQGRACAGPSGFLPDCVVHICIRKAALRWSFYENVLPSAVSCCVANELFTPHLPHDEQRTSGECSAQSALTLGKV